MKDSHDVRSGQKPPCGEDLQGWLPDLATPAEVREALGKAFEYRGDVTLTLRDGTKIEGYVFDRREEGNDLARCTVRLIPTDREEKMVISYEDIARLEFSGRDAAAGKSFELWAKKYRQKKTRGEPLGTLLPDSKESV